MNAANQLVHLFLNSGLVVSLTGVLDMNTCLNRKMHHFPVVDDGNQIVFCLFRTKKCATLNDCSIIHVFLPNLHDVQSVLRNVILF